MMAANPTVVAAWRKGLWWSHKVALVTEFRACQYRLYGLFSTKFPEGPECVFIALRPLKPMALQYICLSCFTLPTAHAQGPAQRRLSGVLLSFLFEWSNCLRCNQWDPLPAGFSICLTCPQHSLSTSLFSGTARYFRLVLSLPTLALESAIAPRFPFSREWNLQTKN